LILEDDSTYRTRGRRRHQSQVDRRTGTIAWWDRSRSRQSPAPASTEDSGCRDVRKERSSYRAGLNEIQGSYQSAWSTADGKVDVRNVQCGQQVANELIVERGLQAGEKVIVEGFARVRRHAGQRETRAFGSTDSAAPGVSSGGR